MPVPKSKQKVYGKIVGHLQNLGIPREAAKKKADKAVADMAKPKAKRKKNGG